VLGAGRGISRNHLRIDVGIGGLFVIDLGSRNGSSLEAPGSTPVRLDAWVPYPLRPGMKLTFADSWCVFSEADRPQGAAET
jgi:pSer/pThr/pTyr-binding forkhead associated (FHA) protein